LKNENSNIKKTETTFYNFQSLRKQHSIINVSNNFHIFGQ